MGQSTVVAVGADASGYVSEILRAKDSAAAFILSQDEMARRTKVAQGAVAESVTNSSGVSTRAINNFIKSLAQEASQASLTRAEILQLRAAQLGVADSAKPYIEQISKASSAAHSFSLDSTGARRELLVLAHEMSQGQWKNFGGSLMVLGERTDALSMLMNRTALTIGAVVGVVAASVGITYHAAEAMAEYGASVTDASQKTGLSTAEVQKWNFAAAASGIDAKEATKSIAEFGEAQNKAVHGNKEAAAAFQSLGISMQTVKSSTTADLLKRVADAFANSADGAGKAAVANELFGASGANLIPMLNGGSAGLHELGDAANKAGAIIGDETIKRMAELEEQFALSKAKMSAMTMEAKTELLPTIIALTDAFGDNAAMKPLLHDFYSAVAVVMKSVASAAATVVVGVNQVAETLATAATTAYYASTGQFTMAANSAKAGYDNLKRQGQGYADFMSHLWGNSLPQTPDSDIDLGQGRGWGQINFSKGGQHGARGSEDGISQQLAAQQEQRRLIEDLLKSSLAHIKSLRDQGVIDAETALRREYEANQDALQRELVIAQKQEEIATGKRNKSAMERYAGEVRMLQQRILDGTARYTDDLATLDAKRQRTIDSYVSTLDADIYTARTAAGLRVSSVGMGDQQASHYRELIQLQEDFNKKSRDLERQFSESQIDQKEYDAKLQLLRAYYSERVDIAKQSWSEEQSARADWLNGLTAGARNLADEVADKATFMKSVFEDVTGGMADAWANFVTTSKVGIADLAKSVIADFARMQAKAAISGVFNFITNSAASVAGAFASGGVISGPGTGTSDDILIRASNGESILTAQTTRRLGGARAIDALNSGATVHSLARYAAGGVVGRSVPSPRAESGISISVSSDSSAGSLFSSSDAAWLAKQVQAMVDTRIAQKMKGQGGYAWQLNNRIV